MNRLFLRRTALWALLAVGWAAWIGGAEADVPTAADILHRVLTANAGTPDVIGADVLFKFRVRKPVTAPPDCVFEGTLRLEQGHQVLAVTRQTFGLACWAVNRFVIGRLFEGREPLERFLSRFDFEVLGEKLVDGSPYYLVQGKARDPRANPRGLIGWVDYARGLVVEGTVEYPWGTLESRQEYSRIEGAWVLTYQYLYAPRFGASLEALYSNFRFAPR